MKSVIPSPCINVCDMHKPSGFCYGCGRTIEEIIAWGDPKTLDTNRQAILEKLPQRLAFLESTL